MLLRDHANLCADSSGWRNFWGDTCLTYEQYGWCRGGSVSNTSLSGSLYGFPERACCACGRHEEQQQNPVDQIICLAVHELPAIDLRLLRHYRRELLAIHDVEMWVLFYAPPGRRISRNELDEWKTIGVPIFIWTQADVFRAFPKIEDALNASEAVTLMKDDDEPQYIIDYFWFHASLMLFHQQHGHAYPLLTHIWRWEVDVLLAGRLQTLFRWSRTHKADVVLPNLRGEWQPGWLNFFNRDLQLFNGVAHHHRVWSLVCLGRFSMRFLLLMAHKWRSGQIGYEEVFLPISCLNASDFSCTLHSIGAGLASDDGIIVRAVHVQFRPRWNCTQFLSFAYRRRRSYDRLDFFHPVKARGCLADYLDGEPTVTAIASATHAPPPAPPPPPSPPLPPPLQRRAKAKPFVFATSGSSRRSYGLHRASLRDGNTMHGELKGGGSNQDQNRTRTRLGVVWRNHTRLGPKPKDVRAE